LIEVELKFKVSSLDEVRRRLRELGARLLRSEEEVDVYFKHPCRDFGRTDEALRLRARGGRTYLTYKGPRLYSTGKARLEANAVVEGEIAEILAHLGFEKFAELKKRREVYLLDEFSIYLDEVEGLGSFVEVELLVSSEDLVELAVGKIMGLAARIGLSRDNIVRETYLELFLSSRGG